MGAGAAILALSLHILIPAVCSISEGLVYKNPAITTENDIIRTVIKPHLDDMVTMHEKTGSDPREALVRAEFGFMANLAFRLEVLMDSYKNLIRDESMRYAYPQLLERLQPRVIQFVDTVDKAARRLGEELKRIYAEYDDENYVPRWAEPRSFINIDTIRTSFEIVKEMYGTIVEAMESTRMEAAMRETLLWSLKQKTMMAALSAEIVFLKMIYDYGYSVNLKMKLIVPGVYYLFVYESGISVKIVIDKIEGKQEFFNRFLENYESSVEELVQRTMFYIREDELPKSRSKCVHQDLELMHRDFREIIRPFITLDGAVMRKVEL